ncbi:MAG: ATP-binding protein [Oscillospiraceae bacterium]|nr:ATP-binding protein [Oscillospiraceae bacterium]
MAKVMMMCGKICSGKSTYAQALRKKHNGVILSVDEITLALFDSDVGDKHDEYVERAEKYLYEKSLEILDSGVDVILDWGFWTRVERQQARDFYGSQGIEYEFYFIDISNEEWQRRIEKRNCDITEKRTSAYYVDEGLAEKFRRIFEKPGVNEPNMKIVC